MTLNKTSSVNDLVLGNILSVMDMNRSWSGTMTDLNDLFLDLAGRSSRRLAKSLPKSPSALRVVINRVANRLRTRGISVKFGRTTDHSRTRFVRFSR